MSAVADVLNGAADLIELLPASWVKRFGNAYVIRDGCSVADVCKRRTWTHV